MNRLLRIAAILCLMFLLSACRLFDAVPPDGPPGAGNTPAPTETLILTHPVPTPEPSLPASPADTPAPTETVSGLPGDIILLERGVMETSDDPRYEIDVLWPELDWNGDPRAAAFNQLSESIAQEEIAVFKQGVAQTPDDPAFKEFSSSLQMRSTHTYLEDGLFSVLINVSFYMAGAAHPAHYSHAITYDLNQGQVLALEDLFQPGAAYLETLSVLCLEDLEARGVLAWEDGASPKPENFRVWNITPGGLQITFDEYQVAPYAAGPQTVLIPYEQLSEIIHPEGPLAGFITQ